MRFLQRYELTDPVVARASAVSVAHGFPIDAGVYSSGVVILVDEGFTPQCFASWPHLVSRPELQVLAYTGLGDFFLADRLTGVTYFLDVQEQHLSKAAAKSAMLIDSILVNPRIVDGLLRAGLVADLVRRLGPLHYLECFVLEPWRMLGGPDAPDRYAKGDVRTYVNLVGQTAFPPSQGPRSPEGQGSDPE